MNERLKKLSDLNFLREKMFGDRENFDFILDNREKSDFDSEWMRVYEDIRRVENDFGIDSNAKAFVNELRERAFKTAYDLTSNSDISAYVSEDVELIAKSLIFNYDDEWLATLIKSYEESVFPN